MVYDAPCVGNSSHRLSFLFRYYLLHRSNSNKATDAAAEPSRRIQRGNHRGHKLSCLALLLATASPRHSSSTVGLTTKIVNHGKAGGVASAAGVDGGGQPFLLLLPEEQLDQGDVDFDVDSNRGNTFEFDIDGYIDDEEGISVSLFGFRFVWSCGDVWCTIILVHPHTSSQCVVCTCTTHTCHSTPRTSRI